MYVTPFVFTAVKRMGKGRDYKSKEDSGTAVKRAIGFSCSLGFYLWGPNQNWLVVHLFSQTHRCCAVAAARLPTTSLLFFHWWLFTCHSDMASVTGASHSQTISWNSWLSLKQDMQFLELAALALVTEQKKPVLYPSICCLHSHFAITAFCNFSFNVSFLFIWNPTFLLPCEVKETKSSQPCVMQLYRA